MKYHILAGKSIRVGVSVIFLFVLIAGFFNFPGSQGTALAQSKPINGQPKASNTPPANTPVGTPAVAGGAETTIKNLLCAPTENKSGYNLLQGSDTTGQTQAGGDLYYCINKLYKFGIGLGAVAAVMLLVIAGYLYISGGEEAVSEAKAIMGSTVAGLVILLISYIFLRTINPDLIQFKTLQLPELTRKEGDIDLCNPLKQDCVYRPDGSIAGSAGAAGTTGKGGRAMQSGSGQSQALAKQIQGNSSIKLATSHPSSSDPLSTAKMNIDDTAAGKLAKTSKDGDAKGADVQLSDDMLKGLIAVASKFKSVSVSEIAGGDHSGTSRHYRGYAFDINQANGQGISASNGKSVEDVCRQAGATEVLGPGQPGHDTHVHCAW